jgi:malate synthase
MKDRLFTPSAVQLITDLDERFGQRRLELLELAKARHARFMSVEISQLEETVHIRDSEWTVDPVPAELLERRVELIGGCARKDLIEGMNAGAKSYVADLWNMTLADPASIMEAHRNLERASDNRLSYVAEDGERIRINPRSTTRLILVPRPLYVMHPALIGDRLVPASFIDLALHAEWNSAKLRLRQGGAYLYLRNVSGHLEARLWREMFEFLEERLGMPRGTFRATVMIDSLAAALEADEILFELMHHSAGLSLAPQAYAADHIALFSAPDRTIMPDREHIGLNAKYLRTVSLRVISTCHRRQAHAIGAPAFVLPPVDQGVLKPEYLSMIADKEREAVDGHDGTLVALSGLVTSAMTEFNKHMPRAHQMFYQRPDHATVPDLIAHPEGPLTTEGLLSTVRTVLRMMVAQRTGEALVIQGGRLHDRSSARLSTLLLWHWTQNEKCHITDTGLEIHADVVKYLIRKEGEKVAARGLPEHRAIVKHAVDMLTAAVLAPGVPGDLLEDLDLPG